MFNFISLSEGNAATLLAAAAFFLGAVINASGGKAVREKFVRYGFPWWWCRVTAMFEFLTAVLLVLQPTFAIAVALGACIMVAAILAIVHARDFRHLPPPSVFLLLLIMAAFIQFSS
ncbi:DoxX family protein [Rhizobium sp. SIMBA_035]